MTTTVVNIHSGQPYDIYIGRGSSWGNPYTHRPSAFSDVIYVVTREEAIARYREYLISRPDLMARLPSLRGKRLGCYCKPLDCHGDILAELADYYTDAEYCGCCGREIEFTGDEVPAWCTDCTGHVLSADAVPLPP